jgi:hypothetical protein
MLMLQAEHCCCLSIGLQQYQGAEGYTQESKDVGALFEIVRQHVVGLWNDGVLGIAYK